MRFILVLLCTLFVFSGSARADQLQDGIAAYSRKDYEAALKLWQPLADQGNAEAEEYVGYLYEYGDGVKQDFTEAVKWYRKASDQGNSLAERRLGEMYENGKGVTQDYAEAYFWLSLCAVQNDTAKHLTPEQKAALDKRIAEWKAARVAAEKK